MTEEQAELIAVDPDSVHGQARTRGTRTPVRGLFDCPASGMTEDQMTGPVLDPKGWGFRTKREAERALRELLATIDRDRYVARQS